MTNGDIMSDQEDCGMFQPSTRQDDGRVLWIQLSGEFYPNFSVVAD